MSLENVRCLSISQEDLDEEIGHRASLFMALVVSWASFLLSFLEGSR